VLPESILHYELTEVLGQGGMGVVCRARDTRLRRDVAIKLLKRGADPDGVNRLIREARLASSLNHPNIVTVFDAGETEHGHFIAMEFVRGRTLRSLIREQRPLSEIIRIVRQVAEALAVAHDAGLVHRDVKPENVMVRDDGYVKVLDFGVTRRVDTAPDAATDELFATQQDVFHGTLRYMSPEQATGAFAAASDVFSLGITFYELVTGRHPFEADSVYGVVQSILSDAVIQPSHVNTELVGPIDTLIVRMLEKDPRLRPTAAEVASVLTSPLDSVPVSSPVNVPQTTDCSVGRSRPLGELRRGLDLVLRGRGLVMCVSGEAGIGKTSLVETFLTDVVRQHAAVQIARGRCSERLAGAEAYLVLLDALESLLRPGNPSITRAMKAVAPHWYKQVVPSADGDAPRDMQSDEAIRGSQERLKRELLAFLDGVSRMRPIVLYFDDVHWADESTVDVLAYVTRHLDRLPLLVLVTYRPEELTVQRHPFLTLKRDLQGRGLCREIVLEFLTSNEVKEYVDLRLAQHHLPATFADMLHEKTEGSPLFVTDMLNYLIDQKVIESAPSGWELTRPVPDIARDLPESIRGLIHRKIEALDENHRRMLAVASVAGQEFDALVVAKALGRNEADVEEQLDRLDRVHGFVCRLQEHICPNGAPTLRFAFVHVLYQNTFYAALTPARKAGVSRAVAIALEEVYAGRTTEIAATLAMLYEAAREFSLAAGFFHTAATRARDVLAYPEAYMLGRRALDNLRALPEDEGLRRRELDILLTLGVPATASQGFSHAEARAVYDRARELCLEFNETSQLGHVLYGLVALHIVRLQIDSAEEAGAQIVELGHETGDAELLIQGTNAMGMVSFYTGAFESAVEHFEHLRAHFHIHSRKHVLREFGYDPATAAHCYLSWSRWCLGFPDRAVRDVKDAVEAASEIDYPYASALALNFACALAMWRGEWEEAAALNAKLRQVSHDGGFSYFTGTATFFAGVLEWRTGELTRGLSRMNEGMKVLRSMDARASPRRLAGEWALAYAATGQIDEGLRIVTTEMREATRDRFWHAELLRARAELLLQRGRDGDLAGAEGSLREAIHIARVQHAKSLELRATTTLARMLQGRPTCAEATAGLSDVYGWFREGFNNADLVNARSTLAAGGRPIEG
jgi:tetratricopeptide (TPR) repeat protein